MEETYIDQLKLRASEPEKVDCFQENEDLSEAVWIPPSETLPPSETVPPSVVVAPHSVPEKELQEVPVPSEVTVDTAGNVDNPVNTPKPDALKTRYGRAIKPPP